ncbi:myelin-associated oligodendrocyte basic protein [Rhynchospora pubera]|uniref:Myelin-associated oligodendrocyte basic protein n=1 Tax=Rhynchospora pubera TaxID=906938 RepID=A0AAV8FGH3_9POAL|nr:myelin-associated oligodendrocyte basic protein [Rhynchospora pubera]
MKLPSSPHLLATKSMALSLLLVLIALFLHDTAAASGGAMGGSFSSKASSSSRSRHVYSTSYTTYVYRDSCFGSRRIYTVHQIRMGSRGGDIHSFFIAVFALGAMVVIAYTIYDRYRPKPSVVKLQVALNGKACSLQQDLNHIALKADTSTQDGYKYILEESAKALLRHSEYWLSSHLLERTCHDGKEAETLFSNISFEERSKFDEETLVNIDNHQEQKSTREAASISANPFIVVNVIVATDGALKLSSINSAKDLKNILKKIGGLAKIEILAAHVLWTPQDENDHLSAERVFQDYPLLTEFKDKLD